MRACYTHLVKATLRLHVLDGFHQKQALGSIVVEHALWAFGLIPSVRWPAILNVC